jgi:hypothetical protein
MVHSVYALEPGAHFHKEEVLFVLCVFPSIKPCVFFCFQALQEPVLRWIKPPTTSPVVGALADLTRGKADLLAENARLAPPSAHPASTGQMPCVSKERPAFAGTPCQDDSNLERGALAGSAGDEAREGRVNFSVCSGSTHPRRVPGSRSSR